METGTDGQQLNNGERRNDELFVRHYAFMLSTARRFLNQKADAEDVVQSLFFKLSDYELPPDVLQDPKGYLYRTVKNACFDWKDARKSRKEKQGVEKLEITEPRSGNAHQNAANQVEHLLKGLGEDIGKIVMLHAEKGHSDAEIAAMLGHTRSKVASILNRAREKLRKIRRGGTDPPSRPKIDELSGTEE